MLDKIEVNTGSRTEFLDITPKIREIIEKSGVTEGICVVFVPHTTAGVTINENADPAVRGDMIYATNKIVPFSDNYQHSEGNSAAHIKSSMFGFSLTLIIDEGRLVLGTWQNVYFAEFDGPRRRKVFVKIISPLIK